MKTYIGTKIIKAEEMTEIEFFIQYKDADVDIIKNREDRPGYYVRYEDGYESWSPKNVFERFYREITHSEKMMCGFPKRKLGYFEMSKIVLLKLGTQDLLNIFVKLSFMPTEINENSEFLRYKGYSERFDELESEEEIPEYLIIMRNAGNHTIIDHVERVNNKKRKLIV